MALSSDVAVHGIQHFPAVSDRQLPDRLDLTSMSVNEQRPDMKEYVVSFHAHWVSHRGKCGEVPPRPMVDSDC